MILMYSAGIGKLAAVAKISGGEYAPLIKGKVSFYTVGHGVVVVAQIIGLPQRTDACTPGFFGFHIHEGVSCDGPDFIDTGGHFNSEQCGHPGHAGDLPPLLECGGRAFMSVLTNRFNIAEVIGRTVVIHGAADDFTSQPSGNSGIKLACGIILAV